MAGAGQFVELRPVLFGVAYRMLGSAAEADDIVQEAYLRWAKVDDTDIASPRAYLTTIVTRLSIDHLRSAQVRRENYRGPWLPEPIVVDETDGPEPEGAELADNLSLAFLVLLEELAPSERAAFLLHDVFGHPYGEIAETLDRSEPACRQLVSRARHRIGDRRKRFEADHERSRELTRRFVVACGTGDVEDLMSLLTDDVVVWTDGGGNVKSAPKPVVGPWRAARFLIHVAKGLQSGVTMREETLNGQPGIVFEVEGEITSAVVVDVLGGRIAGIRVVANPEKLTSLRRARDGQVGGWSGEPPTDRP